MKARIRATGEVVKVFPTGEYDAFAREIYVSANGRYTLNDLEEITDRNDSETVTIPRQTLVELVGHTRKLLDIIDNELHTTGE